MAAADFFVSELSRLTLVIIVHIWSGPEVFNQTFCFDQSTKRQPMRQMHHTAKLVKDVFCIITGKTAVRTPSFTTPCCNMAGLNLAAVTRRHSVQYAFVTTIKRRAGRAGWALILFNCCCFRVCAVQCYLDALFWRGSAQLADLLQSFSQNPDMRHQSTINLSTGVHCRHVADALGCCAFRWFRAILTITAETNKHLTAAIKRVADHLKSLATYGDTTLSWGTVEKLVGWQVQPQHVVQENKHWTEE